MSTGDAQKFRTLFRNKFLVGGDGAFSAFKSGFYIGIGGFKPAYAFRNNSDFRVGKYGGKIFCNFVGLGNAPQIFYIENIAKFNRFSGGGRNFGIPVPKDFANAGTDCSMAENSNFHSLFSLLKVAAGYYSVNCSDSFAEGVSVAFKISGGERNGAGRSPVYRNILVKGKDVGTVF